MNLQTQGVLKSGAGLAGSALGNMLLPGIGGAIGGALLPGVIGGMFGKSDEQIEMETKQQGQDLTNTIADIEAERRNRMNNVRINTGGLR